MFRLFLRARSAGLDGEWLAMLLPHAAAMAAFAITAPRLIAVMGFEMWGALQAAAFLSVFVRIVSDFGFVYFGISEAARRRGRAEEIGALFLASLLAKTPVAFGSFLAATTLGAVRYSGAELGWVAAYAAAAAIGGLQFTWMAAGLGLSRSCFKAQMIGPVISVGVAYFMVQGPEDASIVPYAALATALISAIWVNLVVWKASGGQSVPGVRILAADLARRGWILFRGRLSITAYASATPVLVAWLGGPAAAGAFALGDKLVAALRMPFDAAANRVSAKAMEGSMRSVTKAAALSGAAGLLMAAGSAGVVAGAYWQGLMPAEVAATLSIMGLAVPFAAAHSVINMAMLIPAGLDAASSSASLRTLASYLVAATAAAVIGFGPITAAALVVWTEGSLLAFRLMAARSLSKPI